MTAAKGEEGRRSPALVEASLLLTVFFFGTNFTAVKLVVADVPPVLFAATRFTLAGLLLVRDLPLRGAGDQAQAGRHTARYWASASSA